jgi:hypothetical protein
MDQEDRTEGAVPEGADDIAGGSAPGGAQPEPAEQEGFGEADLGEAQADEGVAPDDDPMVNEPSEGAKGGAREERDAKRRVPDTPATRARGGATDSE